MPERRYLIQKRIRTPAHLFSPVVVNGFHLRPHGQNPRRGIIAVKEIEGNDYREAFLAFSKDLNPVLNLVSVVTQTVVYGPATASHLIYRLDKNPDYVFFFYYADEAETVGMPLDDEEVEDIEKILQNPAYASDQVAFNYLRHANQAASPIHWFTMMIMAAEAFAGTTTITGKCENCGHAHKYGATDRAALENILGEQLYEEIYVKTRIRHKLFHGGKVDENKVIPLAQKAYAALVLGYVKTRYQLESVESIINAPRVISFLYSGSFAQASKVPELEEVEATHDKLHAIAAPADY